MSEALIFASFNPQYDDRLFIELQVQYMKIPSSNLGRTCCVQKLFLTFRTIFVHNMFSPCSAKRRASDKDLPLKSYSKLIEILFQIVFLPYLYEVVTSQNKWLSTCKLVKDVLKSIMNRNSNLTPEMCCSHGITYHKWRS